MSDKDTEDETEYDTGEYCEHWQQVGDDCPECRLGELEDEYNRLHVAAKAVVDLFDLPLTQYNPTTRDSFVAAVDRLRQELNA